MSISMLILSVFSAYAQSESSTVKGDSVIIETRNVDKYKVETNYFGDNWFMSIGAGTQIFFGDHSKQMKFVDRFTPAFDFSVGKWFTPGIGARLAINGMKVKGVSGWSGHNMSQPNVNWKNYQGFIKNARKDAEGYWVGDVYGKEESGAYDLYKTEIKYFNAHADVLFNLSQMIGGYRDTRFYSFSPYCGVGYMFSTNRDVKGNKAHEVSANIGLLQQFRLSEAFDLQIDLRGAFVNDRFDGQEGNRWGEGLLSATFGVTYKFKQRGWNRSTVTTIRYNEAELQALRDRVDELEAVNRSLRDRSVKIPDTVRETLVTSGPLLVTFPINKWTLKKQDRVNLGFLAEIIKANPNMLYIITGYADKGTGTVQRNKFLSKKRAEIVFECLVKEFGVPASSLKMEYKGGVDDMYYGDPRLSRAVLTKVEKK